MNDRRFAVCLEGFEMRDGKLSIPPHNVYNLYSELKTTIGKLRKILKLD
jgi:hypothetical protein